MQPVLCDYDIQTTVYKRFRTKGCLTIAERAAVHDTDAVVGDAILKGRFVGSARTGPAPTPPLMG